MHLPLTSKDPSAPKHLDVDVVVLATGQKPYGSLLDSIAGLQRNGTRVVVDAEMRTGNRRYWAGGDCVSGGKEVVNAAAEGKIAGRSIAAALEGRHV